MPRRRSKGAKVAHTAATEDLASQTSAQPTSSSSSADAAASDGLSDFASTATDASAVDSGQVATEESPLEKLRKSLVSDDHKEEREEEAKTTDALQSLLMEMKQNKGQRKRKMEDEVGKKAKEEGEGPAEVKGEDGGQDVVIIGEKGKKGKGVAMPAAKKTKASRKGKEKEKEKEKGKKKGTSKAKDKGKEKITGEESERQRKFFEDDSEGEEVQADGAHDAAEMAFFGQDDSSDEEDEEGEERGPGYDDEGDDDDDEEELGMKGSKKAGRNDDKRKTRDGKNKRNEDGGNREEEKPKKKPLGDLPPGFKKYPSKIGNAQKRSELGRKIRSEKKRIKSMERKKRQKERLALGDKAPPVPEPRTIENTREFDETVVQANDDEVIEEEALDEFAAHFSNAVKPKILFTTGKQCKPELYAFIEDLLRVFPNSTYRRRGRYQLKEIVEFAKAREFTNLIVINQNAHKINGALVIHLPDGPTAHFRISSVRLIKDIPNHARPSSHNPELILNNFNTRLGHTIGRFFASLVPQQPDFRGRRVITFHNQRDFIFFRHHRYMFEGREAAPLQEIGPRFTLRLKSLQRGTFDSKFGEYEWVHKKKMETSRRRFFL